MSSATTATRTPRPRARPAVVPVHLLALPTQCWRCGNPALPLVGVLVPGRRGGVTFLEFATVAERLRDAVPAARLRSLGIGSIRRRPSRRRPDGYLANACIHCDALLGEHPLREDLTSFLAEGGELREPAVAQLLLPRRG